MDENLALGHLTDVEGALYNEIDAYAAAWLRNLIAAGKIEPGRVSERDIRALSTAFLPSRAHFFAGIGGWSLALDIAGWPRDLAVWTGSCPCQPFSSAGRKKGFDDDRHLWPAWFRLIDAYRPPVVFGEQVASKDGLKWFDAVRADLERAGYAVGGADLCAAGVGAPHIRQRLYFVALYGGGLGGAAHDRRPEEHSGADQFDRERSALGRRAVIEPRPRAASGDRSGARAEGGRGGERGDEGAAGVCGRDAGADDGAKSAGAEDRSAAGNQDWQRGDLLESTGPTFWSDVEWIVCRDGKSRPVEPGTFPLAAGVPGRVGKLRAYGNAIVPPLAAEFIGAVMDLLGIAPTDSVR